MSFQENIIYRFGDFRLHAGEPALTRDGKPVSLQLKSLETLLVLVRRGGQLVTRDELIEEIWPDAFVDENNLSQHIRALRKSLGDTGNGRAMIETVPRRGYRFLPEVLVAAPDDDGSPIAGVTADRLPGPSGTLIGRTAEIAELKDLLLDENVRVLTLTGVGGTGKTTLARAVGREMGALFPDGIFFAELGSVTNPDLVISTIAQALGLKEGGSSAPILDVLKGYVRGRRMLLVIDNFEQVLPAASALSELVLAAPGLKILVTSRAVLRISTGKEYVVPPLTLPENLRNASLDELSGCESVRLFTDRARRIRPNFKISDDNIRDIAQICTRLDGLPLAIELAAARIKIIPPKAILQKLENRLKLLTGGAADLPARQQTIRGTVGWSYDLLDEEEKALFRRLSVFSGGFTFAAAEALMRTFLAKRSGRCNSTCVGDPDEGSWNLNILDPLTSLADKSLILSKELADGGVRFRMLEVVREYALETLEAAGEAEPLSRAHAEHFLELAEEGAEHLQGVESVKWLNLLEDEHDNLRAALKWSLKNDPEIAARIAAALRFFWLFHTHIMEGHKWTAQAYEHSAVLTPGVRAKLLNGLGVGARIQGDYETARAMHQKALTESTAAGDKQELAFSNRGLGAVAGRRGDIEAAQGFYERTLELSRELNDVSEIGYSLGSLGGLARIKGDIETAQKLLEESLKTFRQLGQKERVITTLFALGVIAYQESELASARALFEEAMLIARELQDKIHISDLLDGIAAVTLQDDPQLAAKISGAAGHLRESIGYELAPAERLFRDDYINKIRSVINEEEFDGLHRQGTRLTLEEAIELIRPSPAFGVRC